LTRRRVLLFELGDPHGHQLGYLQHLAEYWDVSARPGCLDLLVTPAFIEMHRDFAAWCSQHAHLGIQLHAISAAQAAALNRRRSSLLRWSLEQGRILATAIEQFGPDDCVMMCFDHLQPSLALGLRLRRPVRLHGIYFRPIIDQALYGVSRAESIWRNLLLWGSLRHSSLCTLFCLDRWCVPQVSRLASRAAVVALADPVRDYGRIADSGALRRKLAIEPGRMVLLMFGELSRRKGTFQMLEAVAQMDPTEAGRIALVMAGPIADSDRESLQIMAGRIQQTGSAQLVVEDRFIPDREIQEFFAACDVVVAPYQRHIGMSAVLVRAARAGKPVLGPDRGLLGDLIRRERLGICVDATNPGEIAGALRRFLSHPPGRFLDQTAAAALADFNRVENFTGTIFGRLFAEAGGR
jgi:glycosyltransferase involved in cell wall biosynthesis